MPAMRVRQAISCGTRGLPVRHDAGLDLSDILGSELIGIGRKPVQSFHRKVLRATIVDGELSNAILQRIELM